jgi:hypothetical protein
MSGRGAHSASARGRFKLSPPRSTSPFIPATTPLQAASLGPDQARGGGAPPAPAGLALRHASTFDVNTPTPANAGMDTPAGRRSNLRKRASTFDVNAFSGTPASANGGPGDDGQRSAKGGHSLRKRARIDYTSKAQDDDDASTVLVSPTKSGRKRGSVSGAAGNDGRPGSAAGRRRSRVGVSPAAAVGGVVKRKRGRPPGSKTKNRRVAEAPPMQRVDSNADGGEILDTIEVGVTLGDEYESEEDESDEEGSSYAQSDDRSSAPPKAEDEERDASPGDQLRYVQGDDGRLEQAVEGGGHKDAATFLEVDTIAQDPPLQTKDVPDQEHTPASPSRPSTAIKDEIHDDIRPETNLLQLQQVSSGETALSTIEAQGDSENSNSIAEEAPDTLDTVDETSLSTPVDSRSGKLDDIVPISVPSVPDVVVDDTAAASGDASVAETDNKVVPVALDSGPAVAEDTEKLDSPTTVSIRRSGRTAKADRAPLVELRHPSLQAQKSLAAPVDSSSLRPDVADLLVQDPANELVDSQSSAAATGLEQQTQSADTSQAQHPEAEAELSSQPDAPLNSSSLQKTPTTALKQLDDREDTPAATQPLVPDAPDTPLRPVDRRLAADNKYNFLNKPRLYTSIPDVPAGSKYTAFGEEPAVYPAPWEERTAGAEPQGSQPIIRVQTPVPAVPALDPDSDADDIDAASPAEGEEDELDDEMGLIERNPSKVEYQYLAKAPTYQEQRKGFLGQELERVDLELQRILMREPWRATGTAPEDWEFQPTVLKRTATDGLAGSAAQKQGLLVQDPLTKPDDSVAAAEGKASSVRAGTDSDEQAIPGTPRRGRGRLPASSQPTDDAAAPGTAVTRYPKKSYVFRSIKDQTPLIDTLRDFKDLSLSELQSAIKAAAYIMHSWQREYNEVRKVYEDEDNASRRQANDKAIANWENRLNSFAPVPPSRSFDEPVKGPPAFSVRGVRAQKGYVDDEYLERQREQDRVQALVEGFRYDGRPSKVGQQDPEEQAWETGGARLRERKQTQKAVEAAEDSLIVSGKRVRRVRHLSDESQNVSRAGTPVATHSGPLPARPGRGRRRIVRDEDEEEEVPRLPPVAVNPLKRKRGRPSAASKLLAQAAAQAAALANEEEESVAELKPGTIRARKRKRNASGRFEPAQPAADDDGADDAEITEPDIPLRTTPASAKRRPGRQRKPGPVPGSSRLKAGAFRQIPSALFYGKTKGNSESAAPTTDEERSARSTSEEAGTDTQGSSYSLRQKPAKNYREVLIDDTGASEPRRRPQRKVQTKKSVSSGEGGKHAGVPPMPMDAGTRNHGQHAEQAIGPFPMIAPTPMHPAPESNGYAQLEQPYRTDSPAQHPPLAVPATHRIKFKIIKRTPTPQPPPSTAAASAHGQMQHTSQLQQPYQPYAMQPQQLQQPAQPGMQPGMQHLQPLAAAPPQHMNPFGVFSTNGPLIAPMPSNIVMGGGMQQQQPGQGQGPAREAGSPSGMGIGLGPGMGVMSPDGEVVMGGGIGQMQMSGMSGLGGLPGMGQLGENGEDMKEMTKSEKMSLSMKSMSPSRSFLAPSFHLQSLFGAIADYMTNREVGKRRHGRSRAEEEGDARAQEAGEAAEARRGCLSRCDGG